MEFLNKINLRSVISAFFVIYILSSPICSTFIPELIQQNLRDFIQFIANDIDYLSKRMYEMTASTSHLRDENDDLSRQLRIFQSTISDLKTKCYDLEVRNNILESSIKEIASNKTDSTNSVRNINIMDKLAFTSIIALNLYKAYDIFVNGNINVHPAVLNDRFQLIMHHLKNIIRYSNSEDEVQNSSENSQSITNILHDAFDDGPKDP
jgi:predicted PurR-regulated permease PerM